MLMTQQKQTKRKRSTAPDATFDGVYLLKMVLYLLVGSLWLKIGDSNGLSVPLPLGLAVGLLFTSHEHFRIDRKIEYAVLLVAMLFGYFAPYGIYINF
jgi:hypothetical protein